jgi:hypothetical protein
MKFIHLSQFSFRKVVKRLGLVFNNYGRTACFVLANILRTVGLYGSSFGLKTKLTEGLVSANFWISKNQIISN